MIPGGLNLGLMGGYKVIAFDDFSEADGTNINGKSLDIGGSWVRMYTQATPTLQTSGGQCRLSGSGTTVIEMVRPLSSNDVVVSGTLTLNGTNSNMSLLGRWNGVNLVGGSAGTYVQGEIIQNTSIRVRSRVNGVDTVLATNSSALPQSNTPYDCQLIISGTSIIFITPLGSISGTIPSSSETGAGIVMSQGAVNSNAQYIDNFKVESL